MTVTSTTPAECAGVVAVIIVPLTTVTFVASAPPIVISAPGEKFAPLTEIVLPPLPVPIEGESDATEGAGAAVPLLTVKLHSGPAAAWLAAVLPTTRQ